MVLHSPLDNPVDGRLNSMPSSQLRQRKQLPPLSSPATELSMESTTSLSPSSSDPLANDTPSPKADDAQLLRLHAQFARAFKLNDAAQLLPFLHKHVAFTTLDGQVIRGPSAVLGFLVGAKMAKLSAGVHVKQARPTRCGDWQTVFVYEHGLVFKEPLYSEAMDWQADGMGGYVITRITHTRLSSAVEGSAPKSVADVAKVMASLPHRLSLSDEDDSSATSSPRSSLSRRTSAPLSACISSSSNCEKCKIGAIVTRVGVATKLSPIRKRKLVNAFLTVESLDGVVLWKSSVAKKQLLPVWRGIDLEFPPPLDEQVVVTLWDYGLFRSLRVATAHTSAKELLDHERGGLVSLELKSMGFSSSSVELSFSITPLNDDRSWRPRSASIVSTVAAIDAAMTDYDEDQEDAVATTAFVQKVSFDMDNVWLLATSAFGMLLVCLALLWLHSSGQLVAK